MSILEHEGEGGKWLKPGNHEVVISAFECLTSSTNNRCVKFTFCKGDTKIESELYSLLPQSQWKLAQLARAARMSDANMALVDPEAGESTLGTFINHRLGVAVVMGKPSKNGKCYSEVADVFKIGDEPPYQPQVSNPPKAGQQDTEAEPEPTGENKKFPTHDGIPF